jgi:prepilin-type N-terminal cleavage/methylation domain-containing protein/prepilin-type processing-associated H-X9-DG protein
MNNPFKRAFTLIEMLVVVAIIMVLAALLFPALGRVRESGRMVRCSSNLRQLYFATMNFTADGTMPSAITGWYQGGDDLWCLRHGWITWSTWTDYPTNSPTGKASKPSDSDTYVWENATPACLGTICITNGSLWGYVKGIDVYVCPTHKTLKGCNNAVRSYSMSTALSYMRFFDVKSTMQVLFGDDGSITNSPYDGQFTTNEVARWHTGKGNVVYMDGHVEQR